MTSETYPNIVEFPSEKEFIDASSGKKLPFPSITDKSTCTLSVVVPAYNEEERCKYFHLRLVFYNL